MMLRTKVAARFDMNAVTDDDINMLGEYIDIIQRKAKPGGRGAAVINVQGLELAIRHTRRGHTGVEATASKIATLKAFMDIIAATGMSLHDWFGAVAAPQIASRLARTTSQDSTNLSRHVTKFELERGMTRLAERLRERGRDIAAKIVAAADLEALFALLDDDHSGTISLEVSCDFFS